MPSTRRHFLSSTAGTLLGVPFLGAMTGNETAAGSQPSGIAQSGAPSTAKRTTGKKPAPARRLDTGLFLDVEDIFSPPELGNDDSIKELATILTEEGLRANFMVIADRALLLKQRG